MNKKFIKRVLENNENENNYNDVQNINYNNL